MLNSMTQSCHEMSATPLSLQASVEDDYNVAHDNHDMLVVRCRGYDACKNGNYYYLRDKQQSAAGDCNLGYYRM